MDPTEYTLLVGCFAVCLFIVLEIVRKDPPFR